MDATDAALLEERWYYSLELEPGVWTSGDEHPNVVLTRELLAGVELEPGTRAIDIGTQEGMVPVLLGRRGVEDVLAYDLELFDARLDLVRRCLGASFETLGGMPISGLREAAAEADRGPFDLVVFSGVLYHMMDPFPGIAAARGLVRTGGLVVVESASAFTDQAAVHLDLGRYSGGGNISFPSAHAMQLMLESVGLQPIDAVTTATANRRRRPKRRGALGDDEVLRGRLAVICRALPPSERRHGLPDRDLGAHVDAAFVASKASPLPYSRPAHRPELTGERGELHETPRRASIPLPDDRVRLALDDTL